MFPNNLQSYIPLHIDLKRYTTFTKFPSNDLIYVLYSTAKLMDFDIIGVHKSFKKVHLLIFLFH